MSYITYIINGEQISQLVSNDMKTYHIRSKNLNITYRRSDTINKKHNIKPNNILNGKYKICDQCNKKKEITDNFYLSNPSTKYNNFRRICKKCIKDNYYNEKVNNKKQFINKDYGYRKCRTCNQNKVLNCKNFYLYKQVNNKLHFRWKCKECNNLMYKNKRLKQKLSNNINVDSNY